MRLAFSDIKKTISRRDGEPRLIPYLLPLHGASVRKSPKHPPSVGAPGGRPPSGKHLTRELDALIALYEAYLGRARSTWPEDRAAILIGDYRLARCLESVLSEWYAWQSPAWPEAGAEATALSARAIVTPSQLRLALYDFVGASYGGFLPATERDAALDAFAADLGITRPTLDDLLYLDSDARAALARLTPEAPTAAQLATRYNQRVLETVLANAAQVEWLLTPAFAATAGEPLGALVKRICFLARRMGVQYDVAYADTDVTDAGADEPPLLRVAERLVGYIIEDDALTTENTEGTESHGGTNDTDSPRSATTTALGHLDIPAESATAPTELAAGLQPANLRPSLAFPPAASTHRIPAESATASHISASSLSSSASSALNPPWLSVVNPSSSLTITLYGPQEMTGAPNQYGERLARLCRALLGYRRAAEKPGRSALAGPGLTGTASVYLHGRPLAFNLDAKLLSLIGSSGDDASTLDDADQSNAAGPQFDSALEQRLHAQFAALERDGEAHGWRLEREPEPILAGATILVPDFALTRGSQRVYLEIAGYWRPEYRERKVRKLAAVRGRVALALAVPQSARAEFAALEREFPILWYKDTVSAETLIALLDRSYNDLDARLAHLDGASIVAEVATRGFIPPVEGMALLRCYSRGELVRALDLLQRSAHAAGDPAPEWLDGIGLCSPVWLDELLRAMRQMVMDADGQRLALAELLAALSTRFAGHSGVTLAESAIEALARRAGLYITRASIFDAEVSLEDVPIPGAAAKTNPPKAPTTQPRRPPRRTHTRTSPYTTQSIFPPEQPGPDHPAPDIPARAP